MTRTDRHRRRSRAGRRGLTLLEVMLATVMLLASVMALSRVAFLARRHAISSEDRTKAQILCQNIVQELLAGVRPLDNVSPELIEGDQWVHSIGIEMVEGSTLAAVTVTVARIDEEESALPTEEEMSGYRLVRWMRTGRTSIMDDLDALESMDEIDGMNATGGATFEAPRQVPVVRNIERPVPIVSRSSRSRNMREVAFRLRENLTTAPMDTPLDGGPGQW